MKSRKIPQKMVRTFSGWVVALVLAILFMSLSGDRDTMGSRAMAAYPSNKSASLWVELSHQDISADFQACISQGDTVMMMSF